MFTLTPPGQPQKPFSSHFSSPLEHAALCSKGRWLGPGLSDVLPPACSHPPASMNNKWGRKLFFPSTTAMKALHPLGTRLPSSLGPSCPPAPARHPSPALSPSPHSLASCENSQLVKFNLFKARHGWSPIMHKARDACRCACFLAPSTLYSTKPVLDAYLQPGPSARGLPGEPRASCRNQPFFHCKQQGSIQSLTLASAKTPRLLQTAWPLHLKMAKLLLRKTASFLLM